MADLTLGIVEARFADIIWEHEPIGSRQLADICSRELNWKRPTTYNVLRNEVELLLSRRILRQAGRALC